MKNPTPFDACCTVLRRNGAFCDAPSAPDMPFPICKRHAVKLYLRLFEHVKSGLAITPEQEQEVRERRERRARAAKAIAAGQTVVYYLLMPDSSIKIGYTTNLTARLDGLRVYKSAVLATEPGGRDLERKRHQQFAHIRIGLREQFTDTPDLRAHIAQVKATHGEPNITTNPLGQVA